MKSQPVHDTPVFAQPPSTQTAHISQSQPPGCNDPLGWGGRLLTAIIWDVSMDSGWADLCSCAIGLPARVSLSAV